MRILVTGDRNWSDRDAIERALRRCPDGPHILVHGAARGADRIAAEVAQALGWAVEAFPANWEKHGKAAGPIRNRQMLNEGTPQLVIAFHNDLANSKGTADMVRVAEKAGVPVVKVALSCRG